MYSLRFAQCRTVYPLQIVRPIGKFRVDAQAFLDQFLTDVCLNQCIIDCFVGDSLKRSTARASKGHSTYFPCEYCKSRGQLLHLLDSNLEIKKQSLQQQKQSIISKLAQANAQNDQEEIKTLKTMLSSVNENIKTLNTKHNKIVWPAVTRNGDLRTIEKVTEIVNKIENDEILSLDEAKGIVGRSLFLDIPYFPYLEDIPTEYMHNTCLGVVKRCIELTFNVGEARQRTTTRKLSLASKFNELMSSVKVMRESSRRARRLDFSVMKAQEFRNIALFYFVLVIDCIDETAEERCLWLLLTYMIRMCVIPNEEYETLDPNIIDFCSNQFYLLYEELFHARNCSYNTHVFGSHFKLMRVHGPLTLTSAFGFESFYGEMRHSFVPETLSPLKQIMQKILMKRTISSHCCKPTIYYSPKDSALESNSLVYIFKNKEYNLLKVLSMEGSKFECAKVGKYKATFPETPTLNWEKIGVF